MKLNSIKYTYNTELYSSKSEVVCGVLQLFPHKNRGFWEYIRL